MSRLGPSDQIDSAAHVDKSDLVKISAVVWTAVTYVAVVIGSGKADRIAKRTCGRFGDGREKRRRCVEERENWKRTWDGQRGYRGLVILIIMKREEGKRGSEKREASGDTKRKR